MEELVILEKKEPVTTTLIVADGMKVKHEAILKLVRKYEPRFQSMKTFGFKSQKSGGRPTSFCYLDEEQTTFLISLMKNSDVVVDFKFRLTKEFYRMKKVLSEMTVRQKNDAWNESRKQGKLSRREETDTIKEFVEYAESQGSTQANRYYANISKMENSALFFLEQKFPNLRDALTGQQLHIIATADIAVAQALTEGMNQKLHYKEIFLLAKRRIERMAEIIPKTIVPMTEQKLIT
jgi:phage regulator Rha-like protein